MSDPLNPEDPLPKAADVRSYIVQKKMDEVSASDKKLQKKMEENRVFAEEFMRSHLTEEEHAFMHRSFTKAVEKEETEALMYQFPSDLCTDRGRAINNAEEGWTETLQGKAKEVYELFEKEARPAGYKLKAMTVTFEHGMPGDIGLFLSWK